MSRSDANEQSRLSRAEAACVNERASDICDNRGGARASVKEREDIYDPCVENWGDLAPGRLITGNGPV